MTTIQRYPHLEILPLSNICLHEHHDPQRTQPLKDRIAAAGKLYNPPLVIPFAPEDEHYMVLDGANRVTSLAELGYEHILVQIVDPNSPGVGLQTWNHVIWNISQDQLTTEIEKIPGIRMFETRSLEFGPTDLALIQFADNGIYRLTAATAEERSDRITDLVNMYGSMARFDRTMIEDIRNLDGLYNQLAGLMIYPQFKIEEILTFCRDDRFLPAGVTRFIVSPRALRVNYPLENLAANVSLEEKRQTLRAFIQDRLDRKGVRIYTETTVLYDE